MTDRGGPQASGGRYQGGGMISVMGNLLDDLGGVDQGTERHMFTTSSNTNCHSNYASM